MVYYENSDKILGHKVVYSNKQKLSKIEIDKWVKNLWRKSLLFSRVILYEFNISFFQDVNV